MSPPDSASPAGTECTQTWRPGRSSRVVAPRCPAQISAHRTRRAVDASALRPFLTSQPVSVDAQTLLHCVALIPDVDVEGSEPARPLRGERVHTLGRDAV